VFCCLKGVEYSLSRQSITKSTFVTRLPSGLPAGSYTVQLVNKDNPDEVTEEVKNLCGAGLLFFFLPFPLLDVLARNARKLEGFPLAKTCKSTI